MQEVNFEDGEIKWSPSSTPIENNRKSDFKNKKEWKPPECLKKIYTDGGSRIIPTSERKRYVGAWAFYDEGTNEIYGQAEDDATNNAMEMKAVINAIEYLNELGIPKDRWCTIVLDSDYVRFGILFWSKKWKENNWVRKDKDGKTLEIKNLDLWKKLYELNSERKISYEKVAGHSGVEGNERVDIHCRKLMDKFCLENNIKRK
jgi:ribonuclease HI